MFSLYPIVRFSLVRETPKNENWIEGSIVDCRLVFVNFFSFFFFFKKAFTQLCKVYRLKWHYINEECIKLMTTFVTSTNTKSYSRLYPSLYGKCSLLVAFQENLKLALFNPNRTTCSYNDLCHFANVRNL